MCRQGKNTPNTTKNNMTPVKANGPMTEGLEQSNIDEVEENDLKIILGECL